jgi:hypothetical protein
MDEFLAKFKNITRTIKLGHYAAATESDRHRHDVDHDADHTPEAEFISYMRTHQRELMSQELKRQKELWSARQAAGREAALERFKALDTDGNGTLDLDEVAHKKRKTEA